MDWASLASTSYDVLTTGFNRMMSPPKVDRKSDGSEESPQVEQFLAWIQELLLWENPSQSLTAFGVFNASFWVLVWSRRPISIVFFLGFLAYSFKTWKTKVWPEIRGQ